MYSTSFTNYKQEWECAQPQKQKLFNSAFKMLFFFK